MMLPAHDLGNRRDTSKGLVYQKLLVVRCQLGERAALEELVRTWERPLLYYVRRLLPSDQDPLHVLQEVWVKVFANLGKLRDPARLAPWLYAITRHTIMDHLRDHYARRELMAIGRDDPPAPEATADDGHSWFLAAEEVHFGLSRVSVVDREVLTLYFLQDLSIQEIAEVLGIPPGTVKSRLFHARNNLRIVLCEKGRRS